MAQRTAALESRGSSYGIDWRLARVSALVLFAAGALAVAQTMVLRTDRDVRATIRQGDLLVRALDAYYADSGSFPQTLSFLVPKYLDSLPRPRYAAGRWTYSHAQSNSLESDAPPVVVFSVVPNPAGPPPLHGFLLYVAFAFDSSVIALVYSRADRCWRTGVSDRCYPH
jgi:hypothetical protein